MFNPEILREALSTLLAEIKSTQAVWIGYSGGLDSHVLLHVLAQSRDQYQSITLKAIHINHGLSPHAIKWENHCQSICKQLNIHFESVSVDAKPVSGKSPEAVAREARYKVFRKRLQIDDVLLTAHHQDDQAETLLLQLFRGAGPKGLASMPKIKSLAKGWLYRPLLDFSRTELHEYAIAHDLQWIDDESNFDTSIDRNYIRHHLMPSINQRWQGIHKTLARTALLCAESVNLLKALANIDMQQCQGRQPNTLLVSKLLLFDSDRRNNIIRYWLLAANLPLPNQRKFQHVYKDMLTAKVDANPIVTWNGGEIRRYRDELYAMFPIQKFDNTQEIVWDIHKNPKVELPADIGMLFANKIITKKIDTNKKTNFCLQIPENKTLIIKFRRGGETCKPLGRKETHSLKTLFQEWAIPPWQRDRIPLIYCDNQLASIIGFCVCEGFQATEGKLGWEIIC